MSIQSDFDKWDALNPHVFTLLVQYGHELLDAGWTKLSISLLVERVRWESAIRTTGDVFKVRNAFKAMYARKMSELPEFAGKFALHARRSA